MLDSFSTGEIFVLMSRLAGLLPCAGFWSLSLREEAPYLESI